MIASITNGLGYYLLRRSFDVITTFQPDPSYKCLRIVQIGRKTKKEGNEATNPHSHFDFSLSYSIYDVALLVSHLLNVHFSSQKSLLNSN